MNEMRDWMRRVERRLLSLERRPSGKLLMASGTVNFTFTANAGSAAIPFPAGRFSVAPKVMATKQTLPANAALFIPSATSITSTGCTIWLTSGNGTSYSVTNCVVAWFAFVEQ